MKGRPWLKAARCKKTGKAGLFGLRPADVEARANATPEPTEGLTTKALARLKEFVGIVSERSEEPFPLLGFHGQWEKYVAIYLNQEVEPGSVEDLGKALRNMGYRIVHDQEGEVCVGIRLVDQKVFRKRFSDRYHRTPWVTDDPSEDEDPEEDEDSEEDEDLEGEAQEDGLSEDQRDALDSL